MSPAGALATPLALPCGATLRNRFAKSAMSEQLAERSAPTADLVRLYERWGEGGAGLLITGNVMIDRRALGEPGNVVVDDERDLAALARWALAAQRHGAAAWMQLNHPGRQSPRHLSPEPVAPSAVPMEGFAGAFAPPRALEEREIEAIVARFAEGARIAAKAGFQGVQVHAAHGYLASQFLSPRTNHRTDRWGGSLENRMRFLLEVVRAIRAAVGPGPGLGVKLNSADFQRGGFTQEESIEVVRALVAERIDLLEVSGGTYEKTAMWQSKPASTRAREAYFLDYAEQVRGVATVPLMLTGGFRTLEGMRGAVESGAVDVVGLARPLAVEPDLPARLLSGEATEAAKVDVRVGIKQLDALMEGTWYQHQLRRLSQGRRPRPGMGRLEALPTFVRSLFAARGVRRGG